MKVLSPESENSSRVEDGPAHYRLAHPSVCGFGGRLKRFADLVGSIFGLVLLSPVMAIVALGIRIQDGGSVFYRQDRVGLDEGVFTILKFRTMRPDAEQGRGATWSKSNDPRCTRFGAVLRRTGLDELPQLWNVLRGDMSLIGPRPERPEFVHEFRTQFPGYHQRHSLLGGLTGESSPFLVETLHGSRWVMQPSSSISSTSSPQFSALAGGLRGALEDDGSRSPSSGAVRCR